MGIGSLIRAMLVVSLGGATAFAHTPCISSYQKILAGKGRAGLMPYQALQPSREGMYELKSGSDLSTAIFQNRREAVLLAAQAYLGELKGLAKHRLRKGEKSWVEDELVRVRKAME